MEDYIAKCLDPDYHQFVLNFCHTAMFEEYFRNRLKSLGTIISNLIIEWCRPGLSSLGVPGVPWHTQILADQLTLFQPAPALQLAPPDFQTFRRL